MSAGHSLDKIGPMCRTVEDCAAVLHAIVGPDGQDMAVPTAVPSFSWDGLRQSAVVNSVRVGYFSSAFAVKPGAEATASWMQQSAADR